MWEHAFYLQYENVKADWVAAFWNLVNWPDVAARFARARGRRITRLTRHEIEAEIELAQTRCTSRHRGARFG